MNPLREFLLTILVLFSASESLAYDPAMDPPVSHVIVCNDGNVKFAVATAAKLDVPFGYTWEDKGWFWIESGQCGLVFTQNYRPPVWIAFAFTDSKGVWGWIKVKPQSSSDHWKLSDMTMCAQDAAFKWVFSAGDLSSKCQGEGVFQIPSSIEYVPSEVGSWTQRLRRPHGLMRAEFRVKITSDDRATAFNNASAPSPGTKQGPASPPAETPITSSRRPSPESASAKPPSAPEKTEPSAPAPSWAQPNATGYLVFGDEVRRNGNQWRYADGTFLSESLLDDETGVPPLRAKQRQYSSQQGTVAANVREVKDVMSAFHACTLYSDSTKSAVFSSVSSVGFDLDDYGVVVSRSVESRATAAAIAPMSPSSSAFNLQRGASLANLSLADARMEEQGCVVLSIPCKKSSGSVITCARMGKNDAVGHLEFRINTEEQGNRILKALKAIAPFYPDGGSVVPDNR